MTRRVLRLIAFSLIAAAVGAVPTAALAEQATPFTTMAEHYEEIRQALLQDTTEGTARHAQTIASEASALIEDSGSARTGVPGERKAECAALFPEIRRAAEVLASATSLTAARDAFGELSKPMVRYREMVGGDRSMVVYCSMAKKAWLQPKGAIGNPYYGQAMARCGQVVSE